MKYVSDAEMPSIVCDRVTGKQTPHELGQSEGTTPHQQVCVIVHQRPGIYACFCISGNVAQPRDKCLAIFLIIYYSSFLDASYNYVMQSS